MDTILLAGKIAKTRIDKDLESLRKNTPAYNRVKQAIQLQKGSIDTLVNAAKAAVSMLGDRAGADVPELQHRIRITAKSLDAPGALAGFARQGIPASALKAVGVTDAKRVDTIADQIAQAAVEHSRPVVEQAERSEHELAGNSRPIAQNHLDND